MLHGTRIPDKVLHSVSRLAGFEDFSTIVKWLEDCLKEQDKDNRVLPADSIGMGQGRAQVIDAILAAFKDASSILAKRSK